MTERKPRVVVVRIRTTEDGHEAIRQQAEREERSWADMARILWKRGLAASPKGDL
jgi:hypothetical protein